MLAMARLTPNSPGRRRPGPTSRPRRGAPAPGEGRGGEGRSRPPRPAADGKAGKGRPGPARRRAAPAGGEGKPPRVARRGFGKTLSKAAARQPLQHPNRVCPPKTGPPGRAGPPHQETVVSRLKSPGMPLLARQHHQMLICSSVTTRILLKGLMPAVRLDGRCHEETH